MLNDTLLFIADDGDTGYELWRSDGTVAGTGYAKELRAATLGSGPKDMIDHHGTLYFTTSSLDHWLEIWKSDGTAAGTTLVLNPWPTQFHERVSR